MTVSDMADVLVELANGKERQIGLPGSEKQRLVIILLFRDFWEDTIGAEQFAADDSWFRHRTLEKIFGHKSLNDIDMACHSVLIDELGTNFGGRWQVSDRGKEFLYEVMDELEYEHPTQQALL